MDSIRDQFLLDPEVIHLNHGSFGACPKDIFEDYQRWQLELERNTVKFMTKSGPAALERSKQALGNYVGADPDDIVFTTNPSYAVNILAKSFPLQEGDEVLTTNIEYGACDRTWNYYCKKEGAQYVRQAISIPIQSRSSFIEEFFEGFSDRTKIVFISHITSSTGLRLPVEEICEEAKRRGAFVIIDGAHVPGHIPLDISSLHPDAYTGACHKWLLTPKGCSFLYVDRKHQDMFDPLLISWGYESANPGKSKYLDYHQLQGTRDFSAFLTIPSALEFRALNDWERRTASCKQAIRAFYPRLCKLLNTKPICPVDEDFLGQMCSVQIQCSDPAKLHDLFAEEFGIELVIVQQDDKVFMRISYEPYNTADELEKVLEATELILSRKLELLGKFT